MKKTDIAMIVLIAGISMLAAFAIANSIPALKVSDKGVQVDTVEKISSEITEPSSSVFNSNAINPTVETIIGSTTESPSQ